MDKQWKLNEGMHPDDAIFDEITFRHLIDALHCNERYIDERSVYKVAAEIFDSRREDFLFLIRHNIDEIIAAAAKGRN